jgi:HK97 family phage major capsid protein
VKLARRFSTLSLVRPLFAMIFAELASPKAIREKIAVAMNRAQAIVDTAEEEDRELSDDEKSEIDKIMGLGKKGDADYQAGQLDRLQADLDRALKLEAKTNELLGRGAGGGGTGGPGGTPVPLQGGQPQDDTSTPLAARVRVSAQAAYRHASLRAYRGDLAESRAYIAGQFLLATLGQNPRAIAWCKEHGVDTTFHGAMTESSNQLGGFLVPTEMEMAIIDLRESRGVFRREARIVPMGSDTKSQPRRTGGLTAYFVGEREQITESEKGWDAINLVAKKIGVLAKYSSELSEDAVISIADDLTSEIAYAFASKEDECGFNGDGTKPYGGIVGVKNQLQAGSIYTALAGNTSFATLDMVDFESMVGMLPEYAEDNAKWYISKAGWAASMMRLIDAAGGNTSREVEGGAQREFLGYPVEVVQVMNRTLTAQTSTKGLVYFGDLRQAVSLGNRRGISIMVSDQRYFETDELGIKGTERFDINVHEDGDANNAGSIIGLSTPGE